MMTVLKTILIVLLIYYGMKLLIRFATPYILRYISKKASQQFEQFFGNPSQNYGPKKEEGQVTIEKKPSKAHRDRKKVGEYVEYEELD